jgi:hypothetical protein
MKRTITIAPVRKSIRVGAGQRMPSTSSRRGSGGGGRDGRQAADAAVREPRLGGRWYEVSGMGLRPMSAGCWQEPPQRSVVDWDLNSQWTAKGRRGTGERSADDD